jgi:dolichol kinase
MIAYFALALAYIIMVSLLVYRFIRTPDKKKWKRLALLLLFIAIGSLLFTYEGVSITGTAELIVGILIFNGMIDTYGSSLNVLYVVFGVLYVFGSYVIGLEFIAQAMLLGMLNEVDKKLEIKRDIFQLGGGLLIILTFFTLNTGLAESILISLIMLGILVLNLSKIKQSTFVSRMVFSLERRNTAIGLGALWLALGALIGMAFLVMPYIIVVFAALFVGDSAATITGVTFGGTKLPYNKTKSVIGTTVYFVTAFAISFIAVGWIALPLALVAAAIESLPLKLDDNFTVSIALVALCLLISHL